jgi:hypothetical protein
MMNICFISRRGDREHLVARKTGDPLSRDVGVCAFVAPGRTAAEGRVMTAKGTSGLRIEPFGAQGSPRRHEASGQQRAPSMPDHRSRPDPVFQ